jgi:hypothetical protein
MSHVYSSFWEFEPFAIFAVGEFAPNEVRMFSKRVQALPRPPVPPLSRSPALPFFIIHYSIFIIHSSLFVLRPATLLPLFERSSL